MRKLTIILFSFCFIVLNGHSSLADSPPVTAESHVKRGNKFLNDSRYFPALDEYREAIKKGFKAPVVYRNLAIIYSELGFLDEAIVEMKKAVTLSPDSDLLRMDLGVMYFAKEELKKEAVYGCTPEESGFFRRLLLSW
jgi:tetratricopeptide (TPR) repeat protein